MNKEEITSVVKRYLESSNEDIVGDYEAIRDFLYTQKEVSSDIEGVEEAIYNSMIDIASHYMKLIEKKGLTFKQAGIRSDMSVIKQFNDATSLEDKRLNTNWDEIQKATTKLFRESNLDTMVGLCHAVTQYERRREKYLKLSKKGKSTPNVVDLHEYGIEKEEVRPYVYDAIVQLIDCSNSLEELISGFNAIGLEVNKNIKEDKSLYKYGMNLSDIAINPYWKVFYQLRDNLEQQQEDYSKDNPKYHNLNRTDAIMNSMRVIFKPFHDGDPTIEEGEEVLDRFYSIKKYWYDSKRINITKHQKIEELWDSILQTAKEGEHSFQEVINFYIFNEPYPIHDDEQTRWRTAIAEQLSQIDNNVERLRYAIRAWNENDEEWRKACSLTMRKNCYGFKYWLLTNKTLTAEQVFNSDIIRILEHIDQAYLTKLEEKYHQ